MTDIIDLTPIIAEQNKKAASSFLNFAVDELAEGDVVLLKQLVEQDNEIN